METQEKQKKTFDVAECFTFYGNWVEAIETLETDADRNSTAYMLFKAIAEYSMYGAEPDFEKDKASRPFRAFWPMLSDDINRSVKRRQRGFRVSDAPDEIEQRIIKGFKDNPNIGQRELARMLGVDKSKVNRTYRKYVLSDTDIAIDNDTDSDNDSMRHETVETVRHFPERVDIHSLDDETEATLLVGGSLIREKDNYTSYAWKKARFDRLERASLSPNTDAGKIARTLARYLSTHEETPLQRKYGDRYGRFILGWDAEWGEPIIGYSVGFAPHETQANNIAVVPETYYTETAWMNEVDCVKYAYTEPERPADAAGSADNTLPF